MTPQHWWKISLRLKLRQSSGNVFQAFFSDVMEKLHGSDFVRIQPFGSNCQIWCSSAESSGDLIDICYLNSVFEFHSRDHLGQVREST